MRTPWLHRVVFLTLIALFLSACSTSAAGNTGLAKAPEGTLLRKIQDRGKVIVGIAYDMPTFGYLNPKTQQFEGFDVDLGRNIAEYVLGDPNAVQFREALPRNYVPYLEDGSVDLILSTMAIDARRLKEIDFSDVYFVAGQSLLVPRNSSIKSLADLKEKRVGTVRSSTLEKDIQEKAPEADVSLFDRYADAVAAMEAGRVDAVTAEDVILYGFQREEPDKWQVVGGQFTKVPYAAGIAKGNQELLNAVNKVIEDMKADGRWTKLYEQWISQDNVPLPPPNDWQAVK